MNTEETRSADTGSAAEPIHEPRRLYRIPDEGIIAGVCAGIADYFVLDPVLIRVIFLALVFLTGGGWIVLYIILWLLLPDIATGKAGFASWREHRAARREARAAWHEEMKNARAEWRQSCSEHQYPCRKCWKRYHRHHCHGGLFGLAVQVLFWALVIWAIYHYISGTQPFWHWVGDHIQTAWAWLNAKVAR